jgi:hypothetical protein
VTDTSIPLLQTLDAVDLLDVTDSGISDEGVEILRKALAERLMCMREGP